MSDKEQKLEHRKVIEQYYEISFKASHRSFDKFFEEFDMDSLGDDVWSDNTTTLRDYEGEFEGVELYWCSGLEGVYKFIADKLGIDVSVLEDMDIRLVT